MNRKAVKALTLVVSLFVILFTGVIGVFIISFLSWLIGVNPMVVMIILAFVLGSVIISLTFILTKEKFIRFISIVTCVCATFFLGVFLLSRFDSPSYEGDYIIDKYGVYNKYGFRLISGSFPYDFDYDVSAVDKNGESIIVAYQKYSHQCIFNYYDKSGNFISSRTIATDNSYTSWAEFKEMVTELDGVTMSK